MHEANLTRLGPLTVASESITENFRAMKGPGELVLGGSGTAEVVLNGQRVTGDSIDLEKENKIEINASG